MDRQHLYVTGCVLSLLYARVYMFGGYGPDINQYLHGVGEFFWDAVSFFLYVWHNVNLNCDEYTTVVFENHLCYM